MSHFKTRTLVSFIYFFFLQPQLGYSSKMYHRAPDIAPLRGFDSCSQFKAKIRDMGANNKFQAYGGRGRMNEDNGMNDSVLGRAPSAAGPAESRDRMSPKKKESAKAGNFTGTNNQHANVDEADFVKFDGKHIYQLQGGKLRIMKAWPAKNMRQVGSINVEGQVRELLMGEGVAIVMTALPKYQTLGVYVIDIKKPASPKVLTRFDVPGTYNTARLIGETIRIVTTDHSSVFNYAQMNSQTSFSWMKNFKWKNQAEKRRAMLNNMNIDKVLNIRKTERVINGNRQELDTMGNCENIYMSDSMTRTALTRLVTLNLKAQTYSEAWAFVTPQTVYASSKGLYLANSGYVHSSQGGVHKTAIHKFDLNGPQSIKYSSTGIVNGNLLNQFSMDEHENHLRVAVNSNERISNGWGDNSGTWGSVNRILVLKEKSGRMEVVGRTKNLAKGERIYAVRFSGDQGFLVTFRQVDPLFTLDLSNPRSPKVVGELKVPGFSSYIHVLSDGRLLTIGKDADPKTGRARGLKLSLFDTSDFANPREIKSLLFNTAAKSEAFFDHKAFSYYRKKGILAIPMTAKTSGVKGSRWMRNASSSNFQSSLLLFKVSKKGFKPAGELQMGDLYSSHNGSNWQWWQQNTGVRRSFFADDIVYAIGNNGIRAAKINKPSKPVGTIRFQQVVASK